MVRSHLLADGKICILTGAYSERSISDLKHKLNIARADHALSEQAAKSAEMQLTLQSIKHKEAIDSLNAQLASIQGSEKMEEAVLELQEKCEYLEKILQEKNAEIEENDDRFIQCDKFSSAHDS